MRINLVNHIYYNFKGKLNNNSISPYQDDFMRPIVDTKILQHEDSIQSAEGEENKVFVENSLYPLGKDLVTHTQNSKKSLPFSCSDEKLILDEYQKSAIELFREGKNVMVTAPTGTGKTLIAEHAINDVLKSGKKVIYTTPLKALCNDKYKQFSALWGDYDKDGNLIGSAKVGLATGDVKLNTNAPIVIMTTEVYRNMLTQHGQKDIENELKDIGAIIFDEFHYMGDSQRGSVWEEALMFSPKNIRTLMLSATIANAKPIINWLNTINDNHTSVLVNVPENERHVPLKYLTYTSVGHKTGLYDLMSEKINLEDLKTKTLSSKQKEVIDNIGKFFNERDGLIAIEKRFKDIFSKNNSTASLRDFVSKLISYGIPPQKAEQYGLRLVNNRKINPALESIQPVEHVSLANLVRELEKKKMTPALYFVYSKKNCKNFMEEVSECVGQLLSKEEKKEVRRRIDEIINKGIFLGTNFEKEIKPCLLKGFAMHHSGMLPQCKSFIEELGRNKLIKVCFATDTLGAGINFPFKTVVFGGFKKYTDNGYEEISANAFKQGAGRAGRRGIDDIGYVVSISKDQYEIFRPYKKIIREADEVQSAFKLSYSLILSPRFLNQPLNILSKSFDSFQRKSYDKNLKSCNAMRDILTQREFIETKNGISRLTQKGKIASKINGINEILMTEMLSEPKITENLTPAVLSTIISIFAPDRFDNMNNVPQFWDKNCSQKLNCAINMANEIRREEEKKGIISDIIINPQVAPYIKMWAETPNSADNIGLWTDLINEMVKNKVIYYEGDFFKKISYTINVLKQLEKAAPTEHIREISSKAIKMIQKSPVDDILLYELDLKEVNE